MRLIAMPDNMARALGQPKRNQLGINLERFKLTHYQPAGQVVGGAEMGHDDLLEIFVDRWRHFALQLDQATPLHGTMPPVSPGGISLVGRVAASAWSFRVSHSSEPWLFPVTCCS